MGKTVTFKDINGVEIISLSNFSKERGSPTFIKSRLSLRFDIYSVETEIEAEKSDFASFCDGLLKLHSFEWQTVHFSHNDEQLHLKFNLDKETGRIFVDVEIFNKLHSGNLTIRYISDQSHIKTLVEEINNAIVNS